jgi:hypothetical protein
MRLNPARSSRPGGVRVWEALTGVSGGIRGKDQGPAGLEEEWMES